MEVLNLIGYGGNALVYKIRQDGIEMALRIERIDIEENEKQSYDPYEHKMLKSEFEVLDFIRDSHHPLFVPVYTHKFCKVAIAVFGSSNGFFNDDSIPIASELLPLLCVEEGAWVVIETMELSGPDLDISLEWLTPEQKLSAMAQFALALSFMEQSRIFSFDAHPGNITVVETEIPYIDGNGYRINNNGILIRLIDYGAPFTEENQKQTDYSYAISELLDDLIGSREYWNFTPDQTLAAMRADYPEIVQAI